MLGDDCGFGATSNQCFGNLRMGLLPDIEDLSLVRGVAHQSVTEAVGIGNLVARLDDSLISQNSKLFSHGGLAA
jgi:hypothetical protein